MLSPQLLCLDFPRLFDTLLHACSASRLLVTIGFVGAQGWLSLPGRHQPDMEPHVWYAHVDCDTI